MTFTEQTGFRRSGPNAICQDHEALLAVREFTFDLRDEDFVRYFEDRTGVAITWSPRCGYAAPFACSDKEWQQVCRDTMQGDETFQRIIRGKLEDAWELWQAELERERDTRKVERTRGVFPARVCKSPMTRWNSSRSERGTAMDSSTIYRDPSVMVSMVFPRRLLPCARYSFHVVSVP